MWKHKNFINLQLCAGGQDELAGTWVFNDTIDIGSSGQGFAINFTSNNVQYNGFDLAGNEKPKYLAYGSTTSNVGGTVYDASAGWVDEAYKTITITSKLSEVTKGDTLLTWLQANATKQSAPQPTLTFKHFFDSGTIGTGTVKFRHYSQQEPSTGETWILDESLQAFGTSSKQFAVNFTFDSVRYTGIKFTFESPLASYLYWTGESSLLVYNYGDVAWAVTSRTIIFDEPVTDTTLLAWLQANGVKQ